MTSPDELFGTAAAISTLPVPREYDATRYLEHQQDTDDEQEAVQSLTSTTYVEEATENGGIRVEPYPHQDEIPVELILKTAVGEATFGLSPEEAREVARKLRSAAEKCERRQ